MSRAEYDRQRAEYIRGHTRAERLLAVWKITNYIAAYLGVKDYPDMPQGNFLIAKEYMRDMQYDLPQVNAFCDSVHAGLTASTLQRFARYAATAFYLLQRYMVMSPGIKVWMRSALHGLPPIENAGALLRRAFREAEHALITLPRTPKHLNE
ncbi:hypothetical protein BHU11_09550 [Tannerella sp. oral taxon 808]|nr:hypothetical protein BHU11_09550 [Tannerella sp. oral taxon 808]